MELKLSSGAEITILICLATYASVNSSYVTTGILIAIILICVKESDK